MGRSVISLAGDDTVLRAKNSIDLSATDNDVRIKAEHNLDMVGGMGGYGRTLLENKSIGAPNNQDVLGREGEDIYGHGLILKADDSLVDMVGSRLYLRSIQQGHIIVDADQGQGGFMLYSASARLGATNGLEIGIGSEELANNIGGSTLLCVLVKVPFRDLNEKELVLPKGSRVGFYGSFAG